MMAERHGHDAPVGAYGLRVTGLERARRLLAPCDPQWPRLHVTRDALTVTPRDGDTELFSDDVARYELRSGGTVSVSRRSRCAHFHFPADGPAPTDEHMVHPFLFGAAAVTNRWLGRQTFHAGAFAVDGAAWAVSGHKGAGKTSTIAMVADGGAIVLSDDLVVVEDEHVLAGPRCLDLRGDAAAHLGVGEDLGVVGTRRRWRHLTAPAPARTRLAGWIYPAWGDEIVVQPIPPAERLRLLFAGQAVLIAPPSPATMVELAALPAMRFVRPRDWQAAPAAVSALLAYVREAS